MKNNTTNLNRAHLICLSRVIVHDGHVVIADVALLLVELGVRVPVGHQGGRVIHNLQNKIGLRINNNK